VVASAAAVWLLAAGFSPESSHPGEVAAIFDNAQFVVPGEDVKLGGVAIGKIASVTLDPSMRARLVLKLDPRFTPFRADATCSIEPQSLIGERFIQCTPGTPTAPRLPVIDGLPTVPVQRTSAPIDIDLVLATFKASRAERLRLVLNELGVGLAGRADDLNAVVRRANPALQETRRMLDVIRGQRARIAPLIQDANDTLTALERGRDHIAAFVSSARRTTEITARRQRDLRSGLHGLPALLRTWRPALSRFGDTARDVRPIVADLSAAAPQLQRLAISLPAFSRDGRPALDRLASASDAGRRAIAPSRPIVRRLRTFARTARPVAESLRVLSENLRTRGVLEGANEFLFNATGILARFDKVSHIAVAEAIVNPCAVYVAYPTPGCDGHFGGDVRGQPRRARERPSPGPEATAPARPMATVKPSVSSSPTQQLPQPSHLTLPGLPDIPLPPRIGDPVRAAGDLLDYLLSP
jgi:virulence factor Mce-like protein